MYTKVSNQILSRMTSPIDYKDREEIRNQSAIDYYLQEIILQQNSFENELDKKLRKSNGIYFTNKLEVIDNIINVIDLDHDLLNKKILDPACGKGILLLRIIEKAYQVFPQEKIISNFIKNNLFFVDIDNEMTESTKYNIENLYKFFFGKEYREGFNSFSYDFTMKINRNIYSLFESNDTNCPLAKLSNEIDYVIGNPPYVTLYGRRDKKKSEDQRKKYLENYTQFPCIVKNGKINLIMLFLEHSLDFLKDNGKLSFIIDIAFFETAFKYTRKYLLENSKILSLDTGITFDRVASGQLILKIQKTKLFKDHLVIIRNLETKKSIKINQADWYKPEDEFRFRINKCEITSNIIDKIYLKASKSLKELYPKKNLRTCAMLLDREDEFVFAENNLQRNVKVYPYYEGAKGLKEKYCKLSSLKYFYYDKKLQDKINDELKEELTKKGIKNKKRIGLGETAVYDDPKVYIRQSAKEIIASYDDKESSANNSLYVFSLRNNCDDAKYFLRFLCGFLNSDLSTFYAQKRNIIRYSRGKYPQIKIADLYSTRIPTDEFLQKQISDLVYQIYDSGELSIMNKIDELIYGYYGLNQEEIEFIKISIRDFLKS